MAIIGESTKKMYHLGDKVKIVVENANKTSKTIDFVLVEEKENGNTEQES